MALAGSSFAVAAADSVGAAEPATEGAFEDGDVVGRLGLAMLGVLPLPWIAGILVVVVEMGVDSGLGWCDEKEIGFTYERDVPVSVLTRNTHTP